MPRQVNRARTDRVSVRQTDNVGRLSVVAPGPGSVQTNAGQTAADLAAALGFAGDAAQIYDQSEARRAQVAVDRGEATRGNLNDLDESGRFLYHANKTLRSREAKDFALELEQKYAEEFPKDADPAELAAWWQEQVTSTYDGIDDEDVEVMAPILDKQRDRLLAAHTETQVKNTLEDLQVAAAQNARDTILDPEGDYESTRADLKAQFGTEGANEIMAQALIDTMEETGDPTLVERAAPQLVTNPKYADAIERARKGAEDIQMADRRMVGRAESESLVDAGQYTEERARADVAAGIYSWETAGNKLAQSAANAGRAVNIEAAADAFIQGRGGYLVDQKDRQDALALAANRFPGREQEAAFRLGLANGVMLKQHQDMIENATLANEDGFQQAYALYQQYRTADPRFIGSTIKESQQTLFDSYRVMTDQMGLTPEQAMDRIRNSDPEAARNVMAQRDTRDLVQGVYNDVRNLPWSIKELKDTPILQKEFRDLTTTYLAMGGFTAEQASKMALEHMSNNRVTIDGYAFHRNQGWPEDTDEMVSWVKSNMIPEGEDPDDYVVVPDFETRATNDVILLRNGDLPFGAGNLRFDIREQAVAWDVYKREKAAADAIEAQKQAAAEAAEKARLLEEFKASRAAEAGKPVEYPWPEGSQVRITFPWQRGDKE